MKYSGRYLSLTREELLERVHAQMSEKRFVHVLGVEKAAIALAEQYGEDIEKASIAALVHDYCKERPDTDFQSYIDKQLYPEAISQFGNEIWHGLVGADIIHDELGIADSDILNAVRHHTTGSANMSLLEQIIYVADYIEEGRDFPGVEEARQKARTDLVEAVAYETQKTLTYLVEKGVPIYPKTIETYNVWVAHLSK
ncbi:bis(5'-nucleosyl)-tetraphosphatase (symmetrical) YqeK [Vagococcus xieshaowenii]|uniref:bis(5'-nucleosyl)-tetraphosphatase (symmetrical) n=1 Tax=Vagococcus xieshaowenii TaxID=2562451 RepID=A0AAJ5EF16_9ENTE|nr:bis(5'-nucleosyl)-tetraphosphatase (symmetrical) YqeK [Vagococcus xieshaowenii]QCA28319.1 HD domain-containing protein [Vagococcus xieshaowenii]TFZ42293.1 HD domain-containing protein [Vagococcus xieshaowenii]